MDVTAIVIQTSSQQPSKASTLLMTMEIAKGFEVL
jgi:hypothetical protein